MAVGAIDGVEREAVESSNIRSIGYAAATKTLAIEFKSGDVFHYGDVDADLATEFYAAGSKGQFYSAYIKYKKPSRMMTGRCPDCGDGPQPIGLLCQSCGVGTYRQVEKRRKEA